MNNLVVVTVFFGVSALASVLRLVIHIVLKIVS